MAPRSQPPPWQLCGGSPGRRCCHAAAPSCSSSQGGAASSAGTGGGPRSNSQVPGSRVSLGARGASGSAPSSQSSSNQPARSRGALLHASTLGVWVALLLGSSHVLAAAQDVAETPYDHCSLEAPSSYAMPPRGTPPPPVRMSGSRIINSRNGKVVSLRGINWFGFNVGMGMVDGLWAGGSAAATDFSLIAYQLRLLGYNAVRLPFIWKDLAMAPKSLDKDCAAVSVDGLKARLISPHVYDKYKSKPLPGNVSPMRNDRDGMCNTYLPPASGVDRLLFVVQALVAQGMYVVLDYQPMGLEQHPYDLDAFVTAWAGLWRRVSCLPNFQRDLANRVFVDVMNEPDSMSLRWEPEDTRPGAQQLYLGTADALWGITPGAVMFFFEGTGQNKFGLNWGNGFITDAGVIASRGLSDPNDFFASLLRKPYVDRVVFAPHAYPPSITMATFLGTALWEQCRASFGYLQTSGYCAAGSCRRFPVVVGELGSAFETSADRQWLQDFADFVNAEGGAKAYNSVPLQGWLWWAYNENSGDTGGIVTNGWQDIEWEKVNWMIARLGLRPWYMR